MHQALSFLTTQDIRATAFGKTILIGEHSVVYGHKALAMALPSISLTITLCAPDSTNVPASWFKAWHMMTQEKEEPVEERINALLMRAFEKALSLVGSEKSLQEWHPQKILISSQIPLGGGMGGSAAMSTCLVRIAAQLVGAKLSFEDEISYANEVDSLFHSGKASGLDVSAVASNGVIAFQKGTAAQKISAHVHCWLALVDSNERSETATMIEKVKIHLTDKPAFVKDLFLKLDTLVLQCKEFLEQGKTEQFAQCLSAAQECLVELGVSTHKLNQLVDELINHGALGAKLTGAGGGGLVLSVFKNEPLFLYELYGKDRVYLSRV